MPMKLPKKIKGTKKVVESTKKAKKTVGKKGKTPKAGKVRHTKHSVHNSSNVQRHQTLIDLITKLSESSNRNRMIKSQSNLPARLMQLPHRSKSMRNMSNMSNMSNLLSQPMNLQPNTYSRNGRQVFSDSSSKAVSSTYSSFSHNGHTHSKGKKVINDSKQPFIKINEIKNGDVKTYMIPKDTIPYKQPTGLPIDMPMMDMNIQPMKMNMPIRIDMQPMSMDMHMPRMNMNMNMHTPTFPSAMSSPIPESNIIVYSTIGQKPMKGKKGKQGKKTPKFLKANKQTKIYTLL